MAHLQSIPFQVPVGATNFHTTSTEAPGASPVTPRVSGETNEATYHRVYNKLTTRYESFDQSEETGFGNTSGLTSHIADITKKDLIGILSHIRDTEPLLEECQKNSSKATFFDKFYLMKNPEQKWNLRLHHYNARGSGLGGEDSPHYHRWTLASAPLTGGYINVNYHESEPDKDSNSDFVYYKYKLPPNDAQADQKERKMELMGQKVMKPIKKEIYAEGSVNHFPIEDSHSVQTFPGYFGSTLTLAHTGASVKAYSPIFEKKELSAIPQVRNENGDSNEFRQSLEREITFLQILDLKDELQSFLKEKVKNDEPLTPQEVGHYQDNSEANYVETSLLSALAIYNLETQHEVEHSEFSPDTVNFLDEKIAQMGKDALEKIIELNQQDLEQQLFTVSVDPTSELGQQLVKPEKQDELPENLPRFLEKEKMNRLTMKSNANNNSPVIPPVFNQC